MQLYLRVLWSVPIKRVNLELNPKKYFIIISKFKGKKMEPDNGLTLTLYSIKKKNNLD